MDNNDRQHFEDYRRQTQVKHEILAAYLPAYFNILKQWDKNLVFIDGFAGRGTYTKAETGEIIDGSPLKALKLIAENKEFAKKVTAIFVEADSILFRSLEERVDSFYEAHPNIRKPYCSQGNFADVVSEVVESVGGRLAPTFLFVDPCGVSGASLNAIRAVMNNDKCEAFIFFNVDGVRRIVGLDSLSEVLIDLVGSKERASKLWNAFRETVDSRKREKLILDAYCDALREDIGAAYIIPFRIEHEDKQITSHYLIHATKHSLGFRIMKDVMWRHGRAQDQSGGLEFAQASHTYFIPLFDSRGDTIKTTILAALEHGPMQVDVFCHDWVIRPEDMFAEPAYKRALLELEKDGVIEVLGKDGKNAAPADARPRRNGKPTLANDYYVRKRIRSK